MISEYNYRGVYEKELVSTWESISDYEKKPYPIKRDPFVISTSESELPTHATVRLQPLTQVVYFPNEKVYRGYTPGDPFVPGDIVLFLGEVSGMRGHGAFATTRGEVVWGYHTHDFRVIPEEYV